MPCRSGPCEGEDADAREIGREIGVTRERVRQIQLDALQRLREMFERHGISRDVLLD